MLALITNDDGIDAEGIAVLARAASASGIDVTVAAPCWDSSGAAASLAAVVEDGAFLAVPHGIDGVAGTCRAVEASPAFIVRAAVAGAFGAPPEIVLSGVNSGLNAGHAVVHSGTVGAAVTARTYGLTGIAFSTDDGTGALWTTVDRVVRDVLDWIVDDCPSGVVLNVNIPAIELDRIGEMRVAPLASFGAVTTTVSDVDGHRVRLDQGSPTGEIASGSDLDLLRNGHPTVTALSPLCEDVVPPSFVERLVDSRLRP